MGPWHESKLIIHRIDGVQTSHYLGFSFFGLGNKIEFPWLLESC
jgi:hypothetical protein